MTKLMPQCYYCKFFFPAQLALKYIKVCLAYPKGIPNDIWEWKHDHRNGYKGDDGIVFEAKDEESEEAVNEVFRKVFN